MPDNEIPPIKITAVVGGLDAIKQSFRNIEQMAEAHETKLRQIYEQNELKKKQLTQNAMKQLERISVDDTNKRIKVSEDYHRKLEQIEAREALKIRQLKENQEAQLTKIAERGIEARARVEQRSRANRNQNIGVLGSAVAGSVGGLGGFFNVQAGAAVSNLAGGGAMGLLAGTGTVAGLLAIKEAFEVVSFGAKEFTQAILEIGGGFSVSGSMVRSAKNERTSAEISAQVNFAGGNVNTTEINALAAKTAKGTEFSRAEMLEGIRKFQEKTGTIEGFGNFAPFMAKVATSTGTSVGDIAERMGNLKAQFKTLNDDQLMELTRRFVAMGAKGTVEFKDAQAVGKITGFAGSMSGNLVQNIASQVGLAQLVSPGAGSVEEGVTEVSAFNKEFLRKGGMKLGAKWVGGKLQNQNQVIENAVIAYGKNAPEFRENDIKDIRALRFVQHLQSQIDTTKSEKDQRAELDTLLKTYQEANITTQQLDKSFEEVANTAEYKLKETFNHLKDQMGDNFLPMIKKVADAFQNNAPALEDAVKHFIDIIDVGFSALSVVFSTFIALYKDGLILKRGAAKHNVDETLKQEQAETDPERKKELHKRALKYQEEYQAAADEVNNIQALQNWTPEKGKRAREEVAKKEEEDYKKRKAEREKRDQESFGQGTGHTVSELTTKTKLDYDATNKVFTEEFSKQHKKTDETNTILRRIADKIDPDKPLPRGKPGNEPPDMGGFGNPYK